MPTLRSNRVVIGGEVRPATIRHERGVIVEVASGIADEDYGDLAILAGLVDTHVHVNEPGRAEWEGFDSATRAAAAGGTTTIVDMPLNSIPPTVTVDALDVKRRAARGKLSVDTAFWGGIIPGSASEIRGLIERGVSGFKAFMVDSGVEEFPPLQPSEMESAMRTLAGEVPLLLHAEDPGRLRQVDQDPRSYPAYLASRPAESEATAVATAADMAAAARAVVHILHVSSAEGASQIGASKWLSGETCPHYLVFCAEEIETGATPFKCAPPIRGSEHRDALWDALGAGWLTMVVSDHSPAPAEVKAIESGDFTKAWGGIGSLQLRLQATWTAGSERGYGLEHLSQWLSANPAALAGLGRRKGAIGVGHDADFVVFDPDPATTIRGSDLFHRHPITPYEGMTLRGAVVKSVLRGQTVYDRGVVLGGTGKMLERDG